jgi:hypothetical protein
MLTEILNKLMQEARAKGKAYKTLKNGLGLKIETETDGFILTIARQAAYPSAKEWQTVLGYWPYRVHSVLPKTEQKGKWYLLSGKVPTESAMQLTFG